MAGTGHSEVGVAGVIDIRVGGKHNCAAMGGAGRPAGAEFAGTLDGNPVAKGGVVVKEGAWGGVEGLVGHCDVNRPRVAVKCTQGEELI